MRPFFAPVVLSSGFKMSVYKNLQPIDLNEIETYELASRPSKVTIKDFATPVLEDDSLTEFLDNLPNVLAVQSLRELTVRMLFTGRAKPWPSSSARRY